MKVGSIVAVKHLGNLSDHPLFPYVKWLPVQDERTPYMIREIVKDKNGYYALLEEGVIGLHVDGSEIGIYLNWLIELLPPEEISLELVEEQVLEEVL